MVTFVRFLLGFLLVSTSLFMVLLVLIQRGRGGGLAGALGGMGGQSAFGTKAGDLFTKITVGVASFWILLCILSINVLGRQQSLFSSDLGSAAPEALVPAGDAAAPAAPSDGEGASMPATTEPPAAEKTETEAPASPAPSPAPKAADSPTPGTANTPPSKAEAAEAEKSATEPAAAAADRPAAEPAAEPAAPAES
jgi:preprotein translocase subunit SecG